MEPPRPYTVEDLATWFATNRPETNWDLSRVTDDHLRSLNSYLPLVCNTCAFDTTTVGNGGQRWANIWYNRAGCQGCNGNARHPPEVYRARAQACYNAVDNMDDLSQFTVTSSKMKGTITCSTCHRPYEKTVHSLENTSDGRSRVGCTHCNITERARGRMRTRERFLEQAAAVFNNLQQELGSPPFTYTDLPDEVPNHLSIRPHCNTCDAPFSRPQRVSDHLSGHGCQQCGGNERWTRERLEHTIEERNLEQYVVVDRNSIPPDDELKAVTPLTLHCRAHGHQRTKTVSNFVNNGSGPFCTRCSIDQRNLNHTNERSRVIELANLAHVDPETGINPYLYDRLTSERIARRDVVEIGCSQCLQNGLDPYFLQRVGDHLSGHGCNRCNNRSFRPDRPGRYYELKFYAVNDPQQRTLFRKGGITNLTVPERVYRIQCGMRRAGVEFGIRIVAEVYFEVGQDAHDLEQAILNIRDEDDADYTPSTRFHGSTELFALPYSPMQIGIESGLIEENQIVWREQEDGPEE